MPIGKLLARWILRSARRVFTGTPIERLPVTGWVRSRIFKAAYGTGELQTTLHGVTLALPGGDVSVVLPLVAGYYEELELALFKRLASSSSVIADVGANIGLYTCVGAAAMPAGTVTAFEPAPANLAFLSRNIAYNGIEDKVTVVPAAVSDSPGTAQLFLAGAIGNHSLVSNAVTSARYIDVDVTSIDHYFAGGRVDLLKVDVEGFDAHVLRGARRTLEAHRPAVFVELLAERLTSAGASAHELVMLLASLYTHVFVIDGVHKEVRAATREQLIDLAARRVSANLVAVDRLGQFEVVSALSAG